LSSLVKTVDTIHVIKKSKHYVIIVARVAVSWLIKYCHSGHFGF